MTEKGPTRRGTSRRTIVTTDFCQDFLSATTR